jgi:hypothetical protein
LRLWVFTGASPLTDVGALQAMAAPGSLFQVASQFNCLESPGPYVTDVSYYPSDPTQGPRATVSAFPGTLVRHDAAPRADGSRFVQTSDGEQINLLADVCRPGLETVRNGYLRCTDVADPPAFARVLEQCFDAIRVGVHDEVEVVLGHDWQGGVPSPSPMIGQVFTSTVAGAGAARNRPGPRRLPGALRLGWRAGASRWISSVPRLRCHDRTMKLPPFRDWRADLDASRYLVEHVRMTGTFVGAGDCGNVPGAAAGRLRSPPTPVPGSTSGWADRRSSMTS